VKNRRKNALNEATSKIVFRLNVKNIKGGIMISKILMPTDGSKTAQKAAKYGVDLAKQLKASVVVLSVIDQRSFIGQTVPAAQTAIHVIEPIEDYLREAAESYAGEINKRGQEVKGRSHCYRLSWEERFSSRGPRQRYLWCDPQRYQNPDSGGKEVMRVQC
jgi:hypothetical protein